MLRMTINEHESFLADFQLPLCLIKEPDPTQPELRNGSSRFLAHLPPDLGLRLKMHLLFLQIWEVRSVHRLQAVHQSQKKLICTL